MSENLPNCLAFASFFARASSTSTSLIPSIRLVSRGLWTCSRLGPLAEIQPGNVPQALNEQIIATLSKVAGRRISRLTLCMMLFVPITDCHTNLRWSDKLIQYPARYAMRKGKTLTVLLFPPQPDKQWAGH
jgi:hypothetical protein